MKLIELANNTLALLPEEINILNPEDEGSNGYIYSIYFTPHDRPCFFDEALQGEALFAPCAYLGSRPDLHLALGGATESLEETEGETKRLMGLVFKEVDAHDMPDEWICFISLQGPGEPEKLGVAIFGERAKVNE